MDIPPPDPRKMLSFWMEWERGELPPGELLKHLKMNGNRAILEQLVADLDAQEADDGTTVGDVLG